MREIWKKIDGPGKWSVWTILAMAVLALGAYAYIPDKSENANIMHIELSAAAPGTKSKVLVLSNPAGSFWQRWFLGIPQTSNEQVVSDYEISGEKIRYRVSKNGAWQTQKLTPGIDESKVMEQRMFVLGTDNYGRDYLSRLVLGARVSLSVGFIAVFISLLIGIPMGAFAGYYRGWADKLVMWLVNVIWSIPTLLMVITLTFVLGKGFWQVFVAVGLTMWVEVARVVRGQVLSLREKEFVDAARILGFSNMRILFKHVLPNALSPVIVISAANFASAILIESGLSFLGIGAQPPIPSWGGMIRDHYAYIIMGNPYLAILPGLAIMVAVLAFMTLGNSLRDALDVKLNAVKA